MANGDNPDKPAGFAAKGPIKITITIAGSGLARATARKKKGAKKKTGKKGGK